MEVIEKFIHHNDDNLGYEIITNEQVISVFIDNDSSCCEHWGFLTTEDILNDFVGAELQGINLIDTDYNTHPLVSPELATKLSSSDEAKFCFIDIITSNGTLQFAIYNSHNGCYGHRVEIKSKQLNHQTRL